MTTATRPPIRWGFILLNAVLAALIAMAIILIGLKLLAQSPHQVLDSLCPLTLGAITPPPGANIIEAIVDAIVSAIVWAALCTVVLAIYAIIIYFPLAVILALLLVGSRVKERRILHVVLTVLISLPVAYFVWWFVGRITS